MQNLLSTLKDHFKDDPRCTVDGNLNKSKIEEMALRLDSSFIGRLLENESLKNNFFVQSGEVQIFDKVKFQRFINNKSFLPDSYTAFKNKISLSTNDREYLSENKEVVLSWPHKDCVLEGDQSKEDIKRDEVFFNESLAPDEIDHLFQPKVLKNFKKYEKTGESSEPYVTQEDNLIIKGNNLLALHTLLPIYREKVKLIYIDPPYNTGNDSFGYNDKFKHSTWLTFMKNRLEAAKELLRPDGLIFVHCDDNEHAYLKVLMDEVFDNNFINSIAVKVSPPNGVKIVLPPYIESRK